MRIPASLVVMGCVTAVPFGLAIRDTVRHTPRGDELDLTGDVTRAREARERAEREEAKAHAAYEARLIERDALLDSLFGHGIAQRGTLTDSTPEIDVAYDHIEPIDLDVMTISVPAHLCDRLHEKLLATWGPGTNDIWLNPSTHDRAAFSDDACTLRFDRYLEPAAWVDQLPFDVIGTTGPHFDWPLLGTGYGRNITHVHMEIGPSENSFNIVGDTDLSTQAEIRAAIAAKLGVPAVQSTSDPNVWTYNSGRPVRFDASGASRFSIQIGKPSWQ